MILILIVHKIAISFTSVNIASVKYGRDRSGMVVMYL